LVQAPFPLYGNSALLLTIAKYYTPSGRLIQRDYSHTGLYEYLSRNEGQTNLKDMRKTDSGRIVFGGDGIAPDEKYESPKATKLEAQLSGRLAFFFYAPEFFATHDEHLAKDWKPTDQVMEDFSFFAKRRGIEYTSADWDHDRSWIMDRLREELFITAFSREESDRVGFQNDPEVRKAMDSLPSSKALLDKAREIIAHQGRKGAVAQVR
jgi:carboxyl-terminal processing protease